ncbi:MAG: DNA replication/repair protein RecF [Bacteroidetes bacterium]|nr:DNA replication/repair protein RecF [Bacteroidota bacterium]
MQHIEIENFRNHKSTSFDCSSGVNLFYGDNGEGKTNILESISYFCLTRSFYALSDSIVAKADENGFTATGCLKSDCGVQYEVQIKYNRDINQKIITVNKSKVDKASALIGWFPAVILSQEQGAITYGSPGDRRKFVDFVLSQSSRKYLDNLIEYRKILKQRNRILADIQTGRIRNKEEVEVWNESLIKTGTSIINKRKEFTKNFQKLVIEAYSQISGNSELPKILYSPSFNCSEENEDNTEDFFKKALENQSLTEQKIGFTMVGPHRDDFLLQINEMEAKNFASQGQHKTLLVALKMAEFFYLKNACNETPLLLLDDVLSELDEKRCNKLIKSAVCKGQVFITSTDKHALNGLSPDVIANVRKYLIKRGRIERVEEEAKIN